MQTLVDPIIRLVLSIDWQVTIPTALCTVCRRKLSLDVPRCMLRLPSLPPLFPNLSFLAHPEVPVTEV
jgi:hypothetical protein